MKNDPTPLLMEEYRTLRAGILNDIERQHSLFSQGGSSLIVVVVAIAGSWDRVQSVPTVFWALILFGLPITITIYAVTWARILGNTLRAGSHLYWIEERIAHVYSRYETLHELSVGQQAFAPDSEQTKLILSWEHNLRRGGRHVLVRAPVVALSGALAIVYSTSLAVGVLAYVSLTNQPFGNSVRHPMFISSLIFWLIVWCMVVYLLKQMSTTDQDAVERSRKTLRFLSHKRSSPPIQITASPTSTEQGEH
jgi:hypothetical protein